MEFHKAQLEAIRHFNGPCITLAGPGSGKTTVLTYRILNLIEKCVVAPEHILVITFTRAAATEMKERFLKLSDNRYSGVCFQTFHSFFFMILRKAYGYRADNIITQQEQTRFFKNILNEYELEITDTMELIRHATAWISNVKRSGKSPDTQPVAAAGICPQEILCEIYHKYQQYLTAKRLIDFEDMTVYCYDLFSQRKDILWQWQEQYQYILVDEFQDIDAQQFQTLQLLADRYRNLFIVGDDDQSIYGFRGARPACMRQFVEEFGAKQILLRTNYRSHPDIVEASLAVIDENKDRFHKDLEPCEAHRRQAGDHKTDAGYRKEYRVKIREFSEASEQMRYLVQSLKNRINGETCAVLFRTNLAMQGVAARLTGEGIPFSMKEKGRNIYDHFIAQDLLSYLRIAQGCATRADYLRVSNRPYRNISREAFGAEASLLALKKYYEDLTAGSLDAGQQKAQKAVGVWMRQMEFVKNTELKLAMAFLRKACGYERYLRVRAAQEGKTDLTEWQEVLDFITEDAGRYRSLEEWQEAQELYREQLQCRETVRSGMQKKQEKQENSGITLLTVHAAKGLEFDHVWIPDCNEKTFPHGSSREPEHCEEERRIFYVAMTRAKKDLELLCLTGTRERPRFPSRFLIPLNRYHR